MFKNRFFEYEIDNELIMRVSGYIDNDAYIVCSVYFHKAAKVNKSMAKKFMKMIVRELHGDKVSYIKFKILRDEEDEYFAIAI